MPVDGPKYWETSKGLGARKTARAIWPEASVVQCYAKETGSQQGTREPAGPRIVRVTGSQQGARDPAGAKEPGSKRGAREPGSLYRGQGTGKPARCLGDRKPARGQVAR